MKIRSKLFVTLLLVVAGGTVGTLLLAERQFQSWVREQVLENFSQDVDRLLESRKQRLAEVQDVATELAKNEVVIRALGSSSEEVTAKDRSTMQAAYIHETRRLPRGERGPLEAGEVVGEGRRLSTELPLMGVVSREGHRVFISRKRGQLKASWKDAREYFDSGEAVGKQVVGYGLLDTREAGASRVKEVVVTPVKVDDQWAGWFFLGRDAGSGEERELAKSGARESWSGLWVDDEWLVKGLDAELVASVEARLTPEMIASQMPGLMEWQGERYLLMTRELNRDSPLGRGAQVALFSLARLDAAVARLRWGVVLLGGASLLLTGGVSWWLSRRFSGPILRLVQATEKVRAGDLNWKVRVRGKDEFATLASDFNRMTDELSLKEKYHDLLGKTSDPVVAKRLMEGSLNLGGEVREAVVVFCDIRGFTAMTDGMAPAEVIRLLNEHMTAMTRVIYDHGGVVDKFVGDLVMGVFGAPVAKVDDLSRAAACAKGMILARGALNAELEDSVEIGVGLAAGEIVSGLMGSADRLNYTVLGDRVNLAARLCSLAEAGEVLVDGLTAEELGDQVSMEPRGTLEMKGFREAVAVWSLEIDQS